MNSIKAKLFFLTMISVIIFCPFSSIAAESIDVNTVTASGYCGTSEDETAVQWSYYKDDERLVISGNGDMRDYESFSAPWQVYSKNIRRIVVKEGVKRIGAFAFYATDPSTFDLDKLELPNTLNSIGACAFSSNCLGDRNWASLEELVIPESVTELGNGAFMFFGARKVIVRAKTEIIDSGALGTVGTEYIEIGEGVKCLKSECLILSNAKRVCFPKSLTQIEGVPIVYNSINEDCVFYGYTECVKNFAKARDITYVDMNSNIDLSQEKIEYVMDNNLSDVEYTGKEIKPISRIKMKYNDKEINLYEQYDYSIIYKDNIGPGFATATIKGEGCYNGEKDCSFLIYIPLQKCDVRLSYEKTLYDTKEKAPEVTIKYDDVTLKNASDYEVSYSNNKEEGTATVTITGKGNFKGEVTKNFSIYKFDLAKADVSLSYSDVLYDGTAKTPDVTVTFDGKTLEKDKDYSVEIINNTLPGTATVRVTGIGQYSGTVEKSFTITALSIENVDVALKESIYSYDGSPKTPPVEVKLGDKTLIKDTDYILSYENNVNDGTAYAVVTGTGIYKDVIKVSFVILPYNAGMDAVYPEGTLIDDDYVYGVTDDETNEVELFCPANQKIKNVHIPATVADENGTVYTVTSIGNKAFYKNTQITSVVIANTVKSIEDYAFYACKNIKTLKIGSGVEVIGNSAFRKCTKLTAVTLPKSIDSLGKNCFYGCSKLKTITINANSVVDVKANAIKGVSKKCVIKVPKKLVKKYQKEFDKKSGFTSGMKVKKK